MLQCDELSCVCTANAKQVLGGCGQKINNKCQKKRAPRDSKGVTVTVVHTRIILLEQKSTIVDRLYLFVYACSG